MAILGTTYPKFIVGSTTVNLEHTNNNKFIYTTAEIEHKSILSGLKSHVNCVDYNGFEIILYLYKYADSKAKYQELMLYNHSSEVIYYPHSDGNAYRDPAGQDLKFQISKIEPFYLSQIVEYDALLLTFKPTESFRYNWIPTPVGEGYGNNYGNDYGNGF